jgi:uncharacterized membrane protein
VQKLVTKTIIVKEKPSRVYHEGTKFEDFPEFMQHVSSVTKIGENAFRWIMETGNGEKIESAAEITLREENKRIAWSSKDQGDLSISGQATFTALPAKDETQVTVTTQFSVDEGWILEGRALDNFEHSLEEDLRNFKYHLEDMTSRLPEQE